jgi:hypothetical protein
MQRTLGSVMRVVFSTDETRRLCRWSAVVGKRTRVPGSVMGPSKQIPHDLAQYVVEAATHYERGFWGSIAQGATFKSIGRKRTKPGRAVIAANRKEIIASEHLANEHLARWDAGEHTHVTHALSAAGKQWRRLRPGDSLVFEWPSCQGRIE